MRTDEEVIEQGISMENITGNDYHNRIVDFSLLGHNRIEVAELCDSYYHAELSLDEFTEFLRQASILKDELSRRIEKARADLSSTRSLTTKEAK